MEFALKNGEFKLFGNGMIEFLARTNELSAFSLLVVHKLVMAELFAIPNEHQLEYVYIIMTYISTGESIEKYSCFYSWFAALNFNIDFLHAILASPMDQSDIVVDILANFTKKSEFETLIQSLFFQFDTNTMMDSLMSTVQESESLRDSINSRKQKSHENLKLIQYHLNVMKAHPKFQGIKL
jgi:hypothetical protein